MCSQEQGTRDERRVRLKDGRDHRPMAPNPEGLPWAGTALPAQGTLGAAPSTAKASTREADFPVPCPRHTEQSISASPAWPAWLKAPTATHAPQTLAFCSSLCLSLLPCFIHSYSPIPLLVVTPSQWFSSWGRGGVCLCRLSVLFLKCHLLFFFFFLFPDWISPWPATHQGSWAS